MKKFKTLIEIVRRMPNTVKGLLSIALLMVILLTILFSIGEKIDKTLENVTNSFESIESIQ